MKTDEIQEFANYLRGLRESSGYTLREIEQVTGVSNSYLSLLERGLRKPPYPEILRKLAQAYGVPAMELMRKAGFVTDSDDSLSEELKLEKAYQHVINDPDYEFGTRVTGSVSVDVKRFVVEMYERATGRKII